MDYVQTIIPGHIYQSWLQDASGIVSRRGRKRKACRDIISTMKVANLMELPPLILVDYLSSVGNRNIYYPKALMELWMQSTQPPHDSPSARTSTPPPPEASLSSAERFHYQEIIGHNVEDFHSGVGSESLGVSVEKLRANVVNDKIPAEILMGELRANLRNPWLNGTEVNFSTPGNDGLQVRTIPGSNSGHGMPPHHAEVNSGRSNKKRPLSSSRQSGSSLEPVAEERAWEAAEPDFKISRLSENDQTPDHELLVETGPTQTQHPIVNQPVDKITDSIRMQMKSHFETPGAPQVESLNTLAAGMNRKGAALLFYQTCVLASRDFLRVEQRLPYGEILISKGAKM